MTADELLEKLGPGDITLMHTRMLPTEAIMCHPAAPPGTLLCGDAAYTRMIRARAAVDALVKRVCRG